MHKTWEDSTRWRNDVSSFLNDWSWSSPLNRQLSNEFFVKFKIFNPCDRWFNDRKELYTLDRYRWVIKIDKMEIEKSDVVIVNANDNGWGTPIEQYIAYSSGKLVLVFCEKMFPPIWAKEHSHVFTNCRFKAAKWLCDHAKEIAKTI